MNPSQFIPGPPRRRYPVVTLILIAVALACVVVLLVWR
jgi:hypothetical protein